MAKILVSGLINIEGGHMDDPLIPITNAGKVWWGVNIIGAIACMAWLGTQPELSIYTLSLWPPLVTGLVWGAGQWWILRRPPLKLPAWWIGATAVGWLLSLPFTTAAVGLIPRTYVDIAAMAAEFNFHVPPAVELIVGYFVIASLLAFFGIFAGFVMGVPQWLVLRIHARTKGLASTWLGSAAWGWIIGLFAGGGIVSTCVGIITAVAGPTLAFPLWFALGCVGGIAAVVYSLYTYYLPVSKKMQVLLSAQDITWED